MKKHVLATFVMCFLIFTVNAQEVKTKKKGLLFDTGYELRSITKTYPDGQIEKLTELKVKNDKYPERQEYIVLVSAIPDSLIAFTNYSLDFINHNDRGTSVLRDNIQYMIPNETTRKDIVVIVFDYDKFHIFTASQLTDIKKAAIKYRDKN
jgi:hypothetical protein